MKKQIEQVKLFHTTYGQPVLTSPALPSKERMLLRVSLLQEELDELKEAIENNDLVEVADALIDIDYIQKGSLLEFGLGDIAEELFDEVQRSNMSKLDKDGNVLRREDGKILKSDLYSPPDLESIIERAILESQIKPFPSTNLGYEALRKSLQASQEVYTDLEENEKTAQTGIRVEQIRDFEGEVLKIMKFYLPRNVTWQID